MRFAFKEPESAQQFWANNAVKGKKGFQHKANADPEAMAAAANINRNTEAFYAAGGTIAKPYFEDEKKEHAAALEATQSMLLFSTGPEYTKRAINSHESYDILVARDGPGVAGALSFRRAEGGFATEPGGGEGRLYISMLGSTGIVKGTGSALAGEAIRVAASTGVGVSLRADVQAVAFWKKVGMQDDGYDKYSSGVKWMSMTAARASAIAANLHP